MDPGEVEKSDDEDDPAAPRALSVEGAPYSVSFSPSGNELVLTVAPRPLIDDRYMLRRIQVVTVDGERRIAQLNNPGKLGTVAVSTDGNQIAAITAEDPNDPSAGRLWLASARGGEWVPASRSRWGTSRLQPGQWCSRVRLNARPRFS